MPGRTVKPYRLQVRVATAHAIMSDSTSNAAVAVLDQTVADAVLEQTVAPPFLDAVAAAAAAVVATHLQEHLYLRYLPSQYQGKARFVSHWIRS